MSAHIHSLAPGDALLMKGPISKFPYVKNDIPELGLVAGGTGITPMLQLITQVLSDPTDKTKLSLVFANESQQDILLKDHLDALAAKHPQFKVTYLTAKPTPGLVQGFITKDLLQEKLPAPGKGKVFVCGPPPMMAAISGPKGPKFTQGPVGGFLSDLGYSSDDVFKF